MISDSNNFVGPHNIASNYGWFHVYAFTMLTGIICSILFSWYKLHKHKVPTDDLVWSVIFIIPASLFGASFFGKNDPSQVKPFWSLFAFWKAGMSIHGGVLFGVIVGVIFFGFVARKTNVSLFVYGDCIIPNILLGQVIGRWGNFFNHELLGEIVGYSSSLNGSHISAISWLPAFIRDNCFKIDISGQPEMLNGLYVFRQPIFLYESTANLVLWLLITFIVPKMFLWFSKKPWHNKNYQLQLWTTKSIIINVNDKTNIKTSAKQTVWSSLFFNLKNNWIVCWFAAKIKNHKLKKQAWIDNYYQYRPDDLVIKNIDQQYQKSNQGYKDYWAKSKKYYQAYNPENYFVMHSGVQMGLYFFGWNLIRFCLETLRTEDNELFLIGQRTLDYVVLIMLFFFGLIFAAFSQFVAAKYFRNKKWTYEKEYMSDS